MDVALIIPVDPLIVIPVPTLIIFVAPLRVMDEVPIVKIPVIRASPLTYREVPEDPTAPTSKVNLGFVVPIPTNPVVIVVITVPPVPTLSVFEVETPEAFRLVALMVPTVILGVPESPVAVVAVPVKAPINVVAVTTPVNVPLPVTVRALVGFVVPIPTFLNVLIPAFVVLQTGADRVVVLPAPR